MSMTRNNADFHGGPWHLAPQDARASIEANGLRPNDGKVYLANEKWEVDDMASLPFSSGSDNGIWKGADIYKITNPPADISGDDQGGSATRQAIPAGDFKRVGHVAEDGTAHWHPEEHCGR
jgi:hypothetical protein